MRILIHSDEYYPTCAACTYRMKVFADTFTEKGDQVTVICSSANKNGREKDLVGSERVIYSPTIRMKKKTTVMRLLNNASFAVTSIFAAMGAGKVDAVITTSPPPLVSISGWLIAKMKGAKLIYDVRDIWPDVALEMNSFTEDSLFCKVFRRITSFMYRHADMVTTVSPGKVEKLRKHIPDNPEKVRLIGNGFDRKVVEGVIDPAVSDAYDMDQKFTCVYIGNIGLAQSLDCVLKIARETAHKEVQFLIFGKGAEKEKLEQEAKEQGLDQVRFCGVLDHEKVFTVLKKAKVSIIPLKNANMKDSIPTKVYEALGLGCPVFLIANGDSCDIVKEAGLGTVLSPDDQDRMTEMFDQMIDSYDAYAAHREQAQQLMYHKYARQTIAADFREELYEFIQQ